MLSTIALVYVVPMDTMKMPVMNIVHVISVFDGLAAARLTVLMVMVIVNVAGVGYRVFPFRAIFWHNDLLSVSGISGTLFGLLVVIK